MVFFANTVVALQHRSQLLLVQILGVLEVDAHAFGEGLVAVRDDVEEIAERAATFGLAVPDDYRDRVGKMYDYIFWMATPDLIPWPQMAPRIPKGIIIRMIAPCLKDLK